MRWEGALGGAVRGTTTCFSLKALLEGGETPPVACFWGGVGGCFCYGVVSFCYGVVCFCYGWSKKTPGLWPGGPERNGNRSYGPWMKVKKSILLGKVYPLFVRLNSRWREKGFVVPVVSSFMPSGTATLQPSSSPIS